MKRLLSIAAAAVIVAGSLSIAAPAEAGTRTCTGTIGKSTVDNIRVPAGKTCKLRGTKVEGNITVGKNAHLSASKVRVDGNIQSNGHYRVGVGHSRIDGNIQLKGGARTNVRFNVVDGDIQLFSNKKKGGTFVYKNRVDGNLQCKSNSPKPYGGGNKVDGNKENQCKRL